VDISVVLCTYNGAHYLEKQLGSLSSQTRLPSELIICDDGSSDRTIEILKAFQAKAPFPVQIRVNPVRLGVTKNFEQAISLCSRELIALCDQDDCWLPEKLELVDEYFQQFPEVGAVFSDGIVVGADLIPLGYTLWQHVGFTVAEQLMMEKKAGMEVLLKHVAVTGATLVIKATLRLRVLPIPQEWMHDAWIALIASASEILRGMPAPLIQYRHHGANVVGAPRRSLLERLRETFRIDREFYYGSEIVRYRLARDRLESLSGLIREDALALVDEKLRHLEARAQLSDSRIGRIGPILKEFSASGYRRNSFGWQVAVKDFLLPSRKPSIEVQEDRI